MGQEESNNNTKPSTEVNDDPRQVVRAWKREIKKNQRVLERQMRDIENAEKKTQVEITKAVKEGDPDSAKVLAKELIHSRKAVDRIYTANTHLSCITSELDHQLALLRTTKVIQSTNEIVKHMNSAMKIPELAASLNTLSTEMMKAGVIDEMVTEVMDDMDPDIEEEADEEVNKVVESVLQGTFETMKHQSLIQNDEKNDITDDTLAKEKA